MLYSILDQIKKIKKLDKNSEECISELHWLNTQSAESERPLPQIKHLPSTLFNTLTSMEQEVKKLIKQESKGIGYGFDY